MKNKLSRKSFIKSSAMGMLALPLGLNGLLSQVGSVSYHDKVSHLADPQSEKKMTINIFSKHLQWLGYKDMARAAADMGFDGIDVSVRAGGHVLPQQVKTDLPRCVDIIKEAGLKVETITTGITDPTDKYTDDVLQTAARLGIKKYRMGWYNHNPATDPAGNLELIKNTFNNLAQKNKQYNIHGDYENHTGLFGAAIWDLWLVLKDLDPTYTGSQFDIQHATVDGAKAWPLNLKLIKDYIGTITIKDFVWEKKAGKWEVENVPLGMGMVDFDQYFSLLKKYNIKVPISLHFEYALGGAEKGVAKLAIPQTEVLNKMHADLEALKTLLKKHELIG